MRQGREHPALKNVTFNEPFFPGHFPHRPVMPGVMIIEALAQTAGMLAFVTADVVPDENTRFFFVGIDKARFRKPVEPGDQLVLTATLERSMQAASGSSPPCAYVDEAEVCRAEMMVAPETGQDSGNGDAPAGARRDRSPRHRLAEGGARRGRDRGAVLDHRCRT